MKKPTDYNYPDKADKQGSARVSVGKKTYYFGPWQSAASYAKFALWRADFERTGEPTPSKDLPDVSEFLETIAAEQSKSFIRIWLVVVSVTTFSIGWVAKAPDAVDGIPLTEYEQDIVRGARRARQLLDEATAKRKSQTVERFQELMESKSKKSLR